MDSDRAQRQLQRENLNRLADHLWNLPRSRTRFDMEQYADIRGSDCRVATPGQFRAVIDRYPSCNTVACAAGHLVMLEGVSPPRRGEEWSGYILRLTGIDIEGPRTMAVFHWLFHANWSSVDNTPRGAAQRIWWFLRYGLPNDVYSQMNGKAPRCYTHLRP